MCFKAFCRLPVWCCSNKSNQTCWKHSDPHAHRFSCSSNMQEHFIKPTSLYNAAAIILIHQFHSFSKVQHFCWVIIVEKICMNHQRFFSFLRELIDVSAAFLTQTLPSGKTAFFLTSWHPVSKLLDGVSCFRTGRCSVNADSALCPALHTHRLWLKSRMPQSFPAVNTASY